GDDDESAADSEHAGKDSCEDAHEDEPDTLHVSSDQPGVGSARPVSRESVPARISSAASGAFVVIDATPAARSLRTSSGSSTVQGWTERPAAAACARNAGVTRSRLGAIASTGGKSGAGWPGAGSATGWSKMNDSAASLSVSRMRFRKSASNDATRHRW